MGLAAVKSAAPASALAPAPASLQRTSSFYASAALDSKKPCECGTPSGLSGRCESCDGLSLSASRAKPGFGALSASPAPAVFQPAAERSSRSPALSPIRLQRQLRVSAPSDDAEIEAQEVGRQVAMPASRRGGPLLRRSAGATAQRRAIRPSLVDAPVVGSIESNRSSGGPLPSNVRSFMEPRFGADFSGVRIHTGTEATALSDQLNANAFTTGRDIYFNEGQFRPDTGAGRELIAHELAHTIQQGGVVQSAASETTVAERVGETLQRDVAANVGSGATPGAQNRPAATPADGASAADGRTYRMADGRTIKLPDDMTVEEAHKLEVEGLAANKRLGRGPPPKPVPDVHKPADKSAKAAIKPKRGPAKGAHGVHASAQRAGGAKIALRPVGSPVGRYLVAMATPVLARGGAKLGALRQHEQTHDDAGRKVRQAENAVVIPESEGQSKSNSSQVGAVAERSAPAPDENKGKAQLLRSLQENVPQTIEDVDNFKRDMKAQHTGADVTTVVQADKNMVVGAFGEVGHTPPPEPPEHLPEALPTPESAPRTPQMNLGKDAIAPLLPEHTDVSQYTKDGDALLQKEGVTQEQLDMVDSGDLALANKEKKGLEKSAKTEPLSVRQFAQDAGAKVDQELQDEEQTGREHLAAHRKQGLHQTGKHQESAKSALEKKRDEVAAKINGIYQATQDLVTKRLADLDTQSMKRFDEGNDRAAKAFEENVNRELEAYKDDRYSGWFGWAKKAKDWLLGMDKLPRVKEIFETNRETFVQTINKLVADISADGKRVVQECKDQLAKAKAEIKDYVDKLGPGLKAIADKTAGEVGGKLDALDDTIKQKAEELQQKLADKQQAAIKAIDEKIAKMKEAMSGALAKLGNLLLLAAKKFFTWALKQFGYSLSDIERIIDKGIAVLKAIFTKPIQFVKNLIGAAKLGFSNFGANFLTHLKDSIFEWLTGSLSGVTLPSSWDFKGIASVAFQILGLTWANIRAKLVVPLTEPVVKSLETGFDLVVSLVRDGPMAAWEKLQEMGQEIKQAFIDGVKDFIKSKIIQEAIKTILALFVPGAGIVRAIVGIYDTVVFFIQKAKQIIEMIGNFLGSIGEIAAGNITAAAAALENGLARGLTLVINFLARFLRLDGITAKIRAAIEKLRAKVDKVLDTVVGWIVGKAKAGLATLFGGGKGAKMDARTTEQKMADLQKGVTEARALLDVPNVQSAEIKKRLPEIKERYRLTTLDLVQDSKQGALEKAHIHGAVNPDLNSASGSILSDDDLQILQAYTGSYLFAVEEIVTAKISGESLAENLVKDGVGKSKIYVLKRRPADKFTDRDLYSFDASRVSISRYTSKRNDYGFDNSRIPRSTKVAVLNLGLDLSAYPIFARSGANFVVFLA